MFNKVIKISTQFLDMERMLSKSLMLSSSPEQKLLALPNRSFTFFFNLNFIFSVFDYKNNIRIVVILSL